MDTKKAFHVKPLHSRSLMEEKDAEKVWKRLQEAIGEIFNSNASALSFEELYRNAYNLVLNKYGGLLYDGVAGEVTEHLKNVGNEVSKVADPSLIQAVNVRWEYHVVTMNMIRDILMYMDRTYVSTTHKTPIYDLGLTIFRDQVTRHSRVQKRLLNQMLANIELERNGELIMRDQMRKCLLMQVELGVQTREVYQQDFEGPFLEATQQFYSVEGMKNIATDTCAEYLVKVERRLQEERARAQQYLDESTEPKLMRLVERKLLENHATTLIQCKTGCSFMFEEERLQDLGRLFRLFSRVPDTLAGVRAALYEYIKADGAGLIRRDEDDRAAVKFVRLLLERREKYERIVSVAFNGQKDFVKTLKEAFEYVVNLNAKVPHFLSLYVDELMKERAKKKGITGEENLDETLKKVIVIFRHLSDKDIFEDYYKKLLAKRLLLKKRAFDAEFSFDSEESFISKLKAECGQQFTSKLEAMIRDMKTSSSLMANFNSRGDFKKTGMALEVNVLTTGSWPDTGEQQCLLPTELSNLCSEFKEFYLGLHEGRRLTWQTNLGNAEVHAKFTKPLILIVSTYQMVVLLLFNEADSFTYEEILDRTGIPETDLKRHLISLAAPKYRIFNKEPKGKSILPNHVFKFNPSFTSKLDRVRIPLISIRSQQPKKKSQAPEVPVQVEDDRKHLVEAAIVRVMKARKQLTSTILIQEVTRQLEQRFRPSPQNIKKRIEALIEREYLERDEKDRRVYRYKA